MNTVYLGDRSCARNVFNKSTAMQRANGRQKQNSYRFKPRARDTPLDENVGASCSSSGNNGMQGLSEMGKKYFGTD